jgi:hypothetical protein
MQADSKAMRLIGHRLTEQLMAVASTTSSTNNAFNAILGILLIIFALGIYFTPFIIALARGHAYKWVIFGLNAVGFSGVTWLISFIWAVWPSDKSLIDPVAGNVTGTGRRNTGDTLGAIEYGKERGYRDETRR